MLVVVSNLKKRVAATSRCGILRNESLEGNESAKNHFEEGVIYPSFPVVVIFLHEGCTLCVSSEDGLFDVLEELLADNIILLADLSYSPLQMLIRIGCEFGSVVRRVLARLEIKLLQNHCILNVSDDLFDHACTLRHFLLRIPEAINCHFAIVDELIDTQT